MRVLHIRNGRADRHPNTRGEGVTWCGKKLLGQPEIDDAVEVFSSYGNTIAVTMNPGEGACEHCRRAFDAAYAAAFPEGLRPIATFRLDDSADIERARKALSPEALNKAFGAGGRGMDELLDALEVPQ